ncbi:hypothetical protein B0H67DRAFT_583134 [Lasiosphaeris hirsuta]|uniref:Uncharacterized protein n=1 Tax=Lasiosphaeris hirsuta TaxID=260670 RepID=A0AA40A7N9_9PEZI|nr:hypothetical protein B0H67DRAFT_583134 [Lasiosphaeris hirsuta]
MAEVAALGTAAAIAQFISIAYKTISMAKELSKSADGLTETNAELRNIANAVEEKCTLLLSDTAFVKPGSPFSDVLKKYT